MKFEIILISPHMLGKLQGTKAEVNLYAVFVCLLLNFVDIFHPYELNLNEIVYFKSYENLSDTFV